jgi:seryl-tRNA synthetase
VPQVDELRGRQKLKGKPTPEQVEELKGVKENLRRLEGELAAAEARRDELLQKVPGPAHESVPDEQTGDAEGEIVREVGERPQLAEPKEHLELGRFEMERGARLSGSRFGYIAGDAARLTLALYRWALDRLVAQGFVPVIPPVLVREEAMYGTGFFPAERFEIYEIADEGLYLTGTSEVALAGLHMGEILEREQLPLRYTAFSTNFRREAGAAGRDTRGMFRVHQFNKVEMFAYVLPETSWDEHERLLAIEESLAQELGLSYRVVNIAASELSAAAAKRYDLEAWFPSQERYRELTSASNTTDYQARRLGIRYRANGGTEYVHTLNGTAVTDRWALAVLENFQGEVPEVLQEFGAPARVEP